jgi:hypothetical protein
MPAAGSSRIDQDIVGAICHFDLMAENTFGERRPADIAQTHKKNGFSGHVQFPRFFERMMAWNARG